MKKNLFIIVASLIFVFTYSGISYAQQFTSEEDSFSVWFPIKPKLENRTANGIPIREYSTLTGKLVLSVAVNEIPGKVISDDELSAKYDSIRDNALAKFKGKLLSDNEISLLGQRGRYFSLSANSSLGFITISERVFIVGQHFYQILTITPTNNLQTVSVNKFFNSFKLISLAGNSTTETATVTQNNNTAIFQQGVKFYNERNFTDAISSFTNFIRLNPNYEAAYFYRGSAYYKSEKYSPAIADFTKAIALSTKTDILVENLYNRALAYASANNATLALADCDKIISLNPKYWQAYFHRANINYDLNKISLALKDYSKAIELKPDFAKAYSFRADCYEKLGQKDSAQADRETAKALEK